MKVKDESINSKLLECAKAEFMEKGFADASMRTIAERAGVTTGMLYSRQGCFTAALRIKTRCSALL